MCRSFAAYALLLVATPTFAQEKPKPNTLTPKEIADGWVLLFDGETKTGWKGDGAAEVKSGELVLGKGKQTVSYPVARFGENWELSLELLGAARIHHPMALVIENKTETTEWVTYSISYNLDVRKFGSSAKRLTTNAAPRPKGSEAATFCIETLDEEGVRVRNVKLRPLQAKPLLTGNNLDGWKVNTADPKRMASKFAVTKEGELSVKDGPGDLVTEKEFDNFVLQLECKTLGKGLNSGIFFRCIPGQYQNGYEAQIQNLYKDDDRTKPADFGTGAIYRRVPARKIVSNDNEWFTMTVVADGKHISTWVNGYQTVDWTDDRKENENPRQGYRAAKGPISIQGHDPTTDLLFRNIRIAELPEAKK